jgi:hypothetical protein
MTNDDGRKPEGVPGAALIRINEQPSLGIRLLAAWQCPGVNDHGFEVLAASRRGVIPAARWRVSNELWLEASSGSALYQASRRSYSFPGAVAVAPGRPLARKSRNERDAAARRIQLRCRPRQHGRQSAAPA